MVSPDAARLANQRAQIGLDRVSRNAVNYLRQAPSIGYRGDMLIFVIVLLVLWLILAIVGFSIKSLLWLAIIGVVLFVATAIISLIMRAGRKPKR